MDEYRFCEFCNDELPPLNGTEENDFRFICEECEEYLDNEDNNGDF